MFWASMDIEPVSVISMITNLINYQGMASNSFAVASFLIQTIADLYVFMTFIYHSFTSGRFSWKKLLLIVGIILMKMNSSGASQEAVCDLANRV